MSDIEHATDKGEQAVMAKCGQCAKPMSTPLVCDYCHSLFPRAATASDYFEMLGVPRKFDLDEDDLHRRFIALSRHAHPDYHVNESPEVQQLSLQVSSTINDGYRTLKDPADRAAYLLELLGGKSSAEDKTVPDGFLATMMMMQEEIADADQSQNDTELARVQDVLQTQHDGLIRRVGGLFADLEPASACEAVRKDLFGEIRKRLNAISYVRKLLSQVC